MTSTEQPSYRYLGSVFLMFGFYLAATQVAQTLLYTIVAYIVSAANKQGAEFGNTVNEIASQYLLLSFSLAALLIALTKWLGDKALYRVDTFWNDSHKPIWQLDRFTKEEFFRGISSGAIAAIVYVVIFTLSNQVSFLGIYITSTFGTPVFPLFFVDIAALMVLVVCEEYIFRHKILKILAANISEFSAVVLTTAMYIAVKHLQFQLEMVDYFNLVLLNLAVSFFFLKTGKSHRAIGFLLALLLLLHPIAGLPLWDNESPSFFLFKPVQKSSQILTGAGNGPFAGLGLASILLVFTLGGYLSWRKDLEARRHQQRFTRTQ